MRCYALYVFSSSVAGPGLDSLLAADVEAEVDRGYRRLALLYTKQRRVQELLRVCLGWMRELARENRVKVCYIGVSPHSEEEVNLLTDLKKSNVEVDIVDHNPSDLAERLQASGLKYTFDSAKPTSQILADLHIGLVHSRKLSALSLMQADTFGIARCSEETKKEALALCVRVLSKLNVDVSELQRPEEYLPILFLLSQISAKSSLGALQHGTVSTMEEFLEHSEDVYLRIELQVQIFLRTLKGEAEEVTSADRLSAFLEATHLAAASLQNAPQHSVELEGKEGRFQVFIMRMISLEYEKVYEHLSLKLLKSQDMDYGILIVGLSRDQNRLRLLAEAPNKDARDLSAHMFRKFGGEEVFGSPGLAELVLTDGELSSMLREMGVF